MKKALAAIATAALVAVPTAAFAGGSDSPTPYVVDATGITLPAGSTFQDNGHINIKTNLGSFFDAKTNNALRTADSLFSRGTDIIETIELTKQLNKERLTFKTKEISSLTTQIAEMIDLLVTSSEEGKIPELSGPAARGIAEGALVAAHYVEMVGALRYRIDEVINAVGAMADQVAKK